MPGLIMTLSPAASVTVSEAHVRAQVYMRTMPQDYCYPLFACAFFHMNAACSALFANVRCCRIKTEHEF